MGGLLQLFPKYFLEGCELILMAAQVIVDLKISVQGLPVLRVCNVKFRSRPCHSWQVWYMEGRCSCLEACE